MYFLISKYFLLLKIFREKLKLNADILLNFQNNFQNNHNNLETIQNNHNNSETIQNNHNISEIILNN